MCSALDGSSMAVPAFIVAPRGQKVVVRNDIGGLLAEHFYRHQPILGTTSCPLMFAEPLSSESVDELRARLLKHLWALIRYWKADERGLMVRDRMAGLAYSILQALDHFIVAPVGSTADDIEMLKEVRCHWWPQDDAVQEQLTGNIAGGLHEHLYKYGHDPRCAARAEKVGRSPHSFCSCAEYATP
jgi:hypothetical protein